MLSEKMEAALNAQINLELWSGYIYLAMAAYFDEVGLKGMSNWMRIQHKEEEVHALMMFGYVAHAGGRVRLKPIAEVETDYASPLAAFAKVQEHERTVTANVHKLVDLALDLRDHSTNAFLQWFVDEQVEEENNAQEIVSTLKLVGDSGSSLLLLDRELGTRVFTMPAPAAGYGVI
jgi:ferritin